MREVVPGPLDGQRLDRVVALLADVSRAEAADLVAAGAVRVDGAPALTRSRRLAEAEVLEVEVPEVVEGPLVADEELGAALRVVYEDPHLAVLEKPAGLVVHPGAGHHDVTLAHGLLARYPEVAEVGEPDRPGIVHRLDVGTSGLLLVARSEDAYENLVAMLAAREVERRYRALVWGRVEAEAGVVDAPVGRSSRERTRMAVTERGRPALTRYEVRRRFVRPREATELVCALSTGRTHQIRVHLRSIGHPVVGDERYGGSRPSLVSMARPWLHAEHLALEHPLTEEPLVFSSPLPADLTTVLEGFSV